MIYQEQNYKMSNYPIKKRSFEMPNNKSLPLFFELNCLFYNQ